MSTSGNKNRQVVNKMIYDLPVSFYFFTTCVARFSEYRVHVGLKSLKLDFQCMQLN